MMQQHQKKVVKKIKAEEEELQGGKKGTGLARQKSSALPSMRTNTLKNIMKPKSRRSSLFQNDLNFATAAAKALESVDESSKLGKGDQSKKS